MTDQIEQIMGLIMTTTDPEMQERLWVRADALTHKVAGLDEDDDQMTLSEIVGEAEAAGWIVEETDTYCPEHKGCHPDHIESDYGRPVLE